MSWIVLDLPAVETLDNPLLLLEETLIQLHIILEKTTTNEVARESWCSDIYRFDSQNEWSVDSIN